MWYDPDRPFAPVRPLWYPSPPMPTIWHEQGYRFSFYAADRHEPPHVHVEKGDGTGKWWIEDALEEWSSGFNGADRSKIVRIIRTRRGVLRARWDEFFSQAG